MAEEKRAGYYVKRPDPQIRMPHEYQGVAATTGIASSSSSVVFPCHTPQVEVRVGIRVDTGVMDGAEELGGPVGSCTANEIASRNAPAAAIARVMRRRPISSSGASRKRWNFGAHIASARLVASLTAKAAPGTTPATSRGNRDWPSPLVTVKASGSYDAQASSDHSRGGAGHSQIKTAAATSVAARQSAKEVQNGMCDQGIMKTAKRAA